MLQIPYIGRCVSCLSTFWRVLFTLGCEYLWYVSVFEQYTVGDHSFSAYANISYPPDACPCAYQWVINVSFLINFAYLLNEWSLAKWLDTEKKFDKTFSASGEFFKDKYANFPWYCQVRRKCLRCLQNPNLPTVP